MHVARKVWVSRKKEAESSMKRDWLAVVTYPKLFQLLLVTLFGKGTNASRAPVEQLR